MRVALLFLLVGVTVINAVPREGLLRRKVLAALLRDESSEGESSESSESSEGDYSYSDYSDYDYEKPGHGEGHGPPPFPHPDKPPKPGRPELFDALKELLARQESFSDYSYSDYSDSFSDYDFSDDSEERPGHGHGPPPFAGGPGQGHGHGPPPFDHPGKPEKPDFERPGKPDFERPGRPESGNETRQGGRPPWAGGRPGGGGSGGNGERPSRPSRPESGSHERPDEPRPPRPDGPDERIRQLTRVIDEVSAFTANLFGIELPPPIVVGEAEDASPDENGILRSLLRLLTRDGEDGPQIGELPPFEEGERPHPPGIPQLARAFGDLYRIHSRIDREGLSPNLPAPPQEPPQEPPVVE